MDFAVCKAMKKVYIVSAKRTPIGSFLGSFSHLSAVELGAKALTAALDAAEIAATDINMLITGQALQAGTGQNQAKQVAFKAGLPPSTICFNINKVCASSLKALHIAYQHLVLEPYNVIAVVGMESMSNTPFALMQHRKGKKLGHSTLTDLMLYDGLTDAVSMQHMGEIAEHTAAEFQLSRSAQDTYAIGSYQRAQQAWKQGNFVAETISLDGLDTDEEPYKVNFEKIAQLKPAFKTGGTITAANASTLNDGAAAILLTTDTFLAKHPEVKPLATFEGFADVEQEPLWFTTTPAAAIRKMVDKASIDLNSIDLFEINEAFAAVALANIQLLQLDPEKVNVWGGAVALGHPLGASGARIVTTLIHQLIQLKKSTGVAAICNGGGGGSAILIKKT